MFIECTLSALFDIIVALEKHQVKPEDKHQVELSGKQLLVWNTKIPIRPDGANGDCLLYVVGNDILLLILLHNNSLKSVLIMALVFLLLMLFNDGFQSLIVADSGIKGQLLRRKKF